MKFGLAPTTIMIFMFVPSIGVRSSAFNLPESLLEPEHALDLPLDFVKTQAQTQRLEGTEDQSRFGNSTSIVHRVQGIPSRWRGCHTGAHCRAFWIRDDFTFSSPQQNLWADSGSGS